MIASSLVLDSAKNFNEFSKHSFFGINVRNRKINSFKLYFTFEEKIFKRIVYDFFSLKLTYKPIVRYPTDIGSLYPGISIKLFDNKCSFAYYYSVKPKTHKKGFENYALKATEGKNKRTYLYTKNAEIISEFKNTYKIDSNINIRGLEVCKGKGIREMKNVKYEKIAAITDFSEFKKIPVTCKNFSLVSFGKDRDLQTQSYYFANLNTWKMTQEQINQFFSKTIIDGTAINA